MNKYQEAISNYFTAKLNFDNEMYKTMDLLEELADKATPVKARADSVGCYCGNCAYRLGDNNGWTQATVKYCHNCGQKLDWSEE